MSRRMSCSMTIGAVRDRSKTVTRRHVNTWTTLQPGDRLTLIEKGMGLAAGEKQVVLCDVEVVSVTVEVIPDSMTQVECDLEGFPDLSPIEFVRMWCRSHGYGLDFDDVYVGVRCRRIEWRYL